MPYEAGVLGAFLGLPRTRASPQEARGLAITYSAQVYPLLTALANRP